MLGRFGNVLAGIWLIIAPYILSYVDATARTIDVWTGLAVIAIALIAASTGERAIQYINGALGVWLLTSPFLFGYHGSVATANNVVVGLVVIVFSLIPPWGEAPRFLRRRTAEP
ncbi:MAG: SPW repeat protein [Myxococcaceae bacterium]|nr:SPW repeat protein [Myxococcaceae bacterium]